MFHLLLITFSWTTTGFGQGVRRSVASVASIMGPLWAGAAMNGMTTYYLFYGVPLGLLILIIVNDSIFNSLHVCVIWPFVISTVSHASLIQCPQRAA